MCVCVCICGLEINTFKISKDASTRAGPTTLTPARCTLLYKPPKGLTMYGVFAQRRRNLVMQILLAILRIMLSESRAAESLVRCKVVGFKT